MTVGEELKVSLSTAPTLDVESRRGESTSWLFLSFYLLLFAFFMVLNSFSSFESGKRDAVISSVQDAFAQVIGPGAERALGGFVGTDPQARRFQDAVTDIFETAIPLTNVVVMVPGSRLDVEVPAQVFFAQDSVIVRDPLPILDRIVATISSPPEGVAYELAVISHVDSEASLPTDMTAEVARVGNIARALNSKGMPPQSVTIGMERGDENSLKLVFFAIENVGEDTSSLRLWDQDVQ